MTETQTTTAGITDSVSLGAYGDLLIDDEGVVISQDGETGLELDWPTTRKLLAALGYALVQAGKQ